MATKVRTLQGACYLFFFALPYIYRAYTFVYLYVALALLSFRKPP